MQILRDAELDDEVTIEDGKLKTANKSVSLKNIWLVSIRPIRDLRLITLIFVLLPLASIGLVPFADSIFVQVIILIGLLSTAIMFYVVRHLKWGNFATKNGYSIYVRTHGYGLKVSSSPLSYEAAGIRAQVLARTIEAYQSRMPQGKTIVTHGSTVPLPDERQMTNEREPFVAGNEISIPSNCLLAGNESYLLNDAERINRSRMIPPDLLIMSLLTCLGIPVIGVFVFGEIYLGAAIGGNGHIWEAIIFATFFTGGMLFFVLFLYAIITLPAVWLVTVSKGSKELIVYKTEYAKQASRNFNLIREAIEQIDRNY